MSEDVKRETEPLDRFLATYEVARAGDWFNKGKQWYMQIECPWDDEHENKNAGTSTCVVYAEDGGYGFDCKHRCAAKGWKEFRVELEAAFQAASIPSWTPGEYRHGRFARHAERACGP